MRLNLASSPSGLNEAELLDLKSTIRDEVDSGYSVSDAGRLMMATEQVFVDKTKLMINKQRTFSTR